MDQSCSLPKNLKLPVIIKHPKEGNSRPDRSDLLQALGSILVEHGKGQEGIKYMKEALDKTNATDTQMFNLQFAAAGNRLISAKVG